MAEAVPLEFDRLNSPLDKGEVLSFDWEKISASDGADLLLGFLDRFEGQLEGDWLSHSEKERLWKILTDSLVALLSRLDYQSTDDATWISLFKAFERMHDFPHPQYFLRSIDLVKRLPEKINVLALLGMIDAIGKAGPSDHFCPNDILNSNEENRVLMEKALDLFGQWKQQQEPLSDFSEDLADETRDNIRLV
ncbi:hypothetical protein KAR91_83235 [Candidatus Pacearchaeota archaeon]|nr:hypothetical protein [Candidatus Pacearchaeota archaeon]